MAIALNALLHSEDQCAELRSRLVDSPEYDVSEAPEGVARDIARSCDLGFTLDDIESEGQAMVDCARANRITFETFSQLQSELDELYDCEDDLRTSFEYLIAKYSLILWKGRHDEGLFERRDDAATIDEACREVAGWFGLGG